MMNVQSISEVKAAGLCAGCGLCETLCGPETVTMGIDRTGFYRPQVLQSDAVAWEQIRSVCPGVLVRQDHNGRAARLEKLWGPIQAARVGYATDEQVRWQAASGGALSALLIYLLETGQVDGVLHIGRSIQDPLQTQMYQSITRDQVMENCGSLYAPTAPLIDLKTWLKDEQKRFAFVGKPCDVAALKAYGQMNPLVEQRFTVLVSFFCAGVPSLLATYDLIQALGVDRDQIKRLRYRGFGWPGRATAISESGDEFSMSYDESWGKILGPRLQFRCKICPDGVGELADVAFGDAWHTHDGYPSFEEGPGRSLILARTEQGRHILEQAQAAGYLETDTLDRQQIGIIQPYQKKRRQAIAPRLLAMSLLGRPRPRYEGFYLIENAWVAGPIFFVRQLAGMLRRLVHDRARPDD